MLAAWKDDYNNARPHSAFGDLTPTQYANCGVPGTQRGGTLRYVEGFAPRPVAPPSPLGSNADEEYPHRWMKHGAQTMWRVIEANLSPEKVAELRAMWQAQKD